MDQVDPHGQRLDPGGLNRPLVEFIVVRSWATSTRGFTRKLLNQLGSAPVCSSRRFPLNLTTTCSTYMYVF